ncbi:MAG TPA: hypothetical protein PLP01_05540 [Phycisphaerae bacterium]|nr:hypothetical protein [Phycisphaerae bacterium]HOI54690.1 hypothetical protein [Phycisphaerae bacterium]
MGSLYGVWTTVAFLVIIGFMVTAVVLSRKLDGQHHRTSDHLWDELREAHGLTRRQARCLRKAAEKAHLDPESLIFVEPHILQQALRDTAADSPRRRDLEQLSLRLYS